MAKRMRNALALVKIQSAQGVAETPSAATDAVAIEVPDNFVTFNHQADQPNPAEGGLDMAAQIASGVNANLNMTALLKGSGVAGTAPEIAPLLKACGWAETVFETPISSEALAAGTASDECTLGTTAGSSDDTYNGAPILFTGDVVGESVIGDYIGADKLAILADDMDDVESGEVLDADVDYVIPAHVKYQPASASIPYLTIWLYIDGKVWKFYDCQGTLDLTNAARQAGRISFNMSALFDDEYDAAVPAGAVFDDVQAVPFLNGRAVYERDRIAINQFQLTNGNELTFTDDPNQQEGFGSPIITGRRITAQIDPEDVSKATRDVIAGWRAQTKGILHIRYGQTAGNKVSVTLPEAQRVDPPGVNSRNGIVARNVAIQAATPVDGAAILTFW